MKNPLFVDFLDADKFGSYINQAQITGGFCK